MAMWPRIPWKFTMGGYSKASPKCCTIGSSGCVPFTICCCSSQHNLIISQNKPYWLLALLNLLQNGGYVIFPLYDVPGYPRLVGFAIVTMGFMTEFATISKHMC